MSKNKKDRILYCRSFLLTMGVCLVIFSLWFAVANYQRQELFALLPFTIFSAFLLSGFALACLGLYGPSNKIEKWADSASSHWISILLMALAYPVYLLLLSRNKGNKNA